MLRSFLVRRGGLLALAITAACVVLIRACLQSITLDEAASFLGFAIKPWPAHWYPSSDNHVLNSMLMRFAATVFGVSNLTARLPAVAGAMLYIGSAFSLSCILTNRALLQLLLFLCLVYNPMILDYLVAARGYSLAIGFFLAGIAVITSAMMADGIAPATLYKKAVWISVLLALSCTANFSFAIANAVTLNAFLLWAIHRSRGGLAQSIRLALLTYGPGLLIGFLICGSVIANWRQGELYFGSKNMAEMWSGFATSIFDELNPQLVNPMLITGLTRFGHILPLITTIVGLLLVGAMEIRCWRRSNQCPEALRDLVRLTVAVFVIALLLHWLAFKTLHLPLPKDRTGLFFLPLWTLAFVGSLASTYAFKPWAIFRWSGLTVLLVAAFYFVGCLRLGYFKEWRFDSNTKTLYWISENLHRQCGITKFATDWRYQMPLNFYREEYKNYSLNEFTYFTGINPPAEQDAYTIFLPTSEEFIRQQKLRVVYKDDDSGAAVAVRSCGVSTSLLR